MGATGAVGQVFMWMLSDHPWFELAYCTASAARVGQKYASTVHWVMPFEIPEAIKDIEVREFDFDAMEEAGVSIVFSALPAAVAAEAEPQLRARGFYVFSNAAAMRYDSNVPILIPETNMEQLDLIRSQGYPQTGFVVTNANCVTTGLAMALAPLRKFGIKTITINSYQSVSGAGYPGLSSFDITDTFPSIRKSMHIQYVFLSCSVISRLSGLILSRMSRLMMSSVHGPISRKFPIFPQLQSSRLSIHRSRLSLSQSMLSGAIPREWLSIQEESGSSTARSVLSFLSTTLSKGLLAVLSRMQRLLSQDSSTNNISCFHNDGGGVFSASINFSRQQ